MRRYALLAATLSAVAVLPQDPAPSGAGAPADTVLVRVGDVDISLGEYKDFLVQSYAMGPLRDLVRLRLLEGEARRLGVQFTAEELAAAVETTWRQLLDARHKGDATAMLTELGQQGFDEQSFRAFWSLQHRREELPARIVRATRVPTQERIRERFDREFGVDGVKVVVRHILINSAVIRADMARSGVSPAAITDDLVAVTLAEKADLMLAELRGGASFESIARRESHDRSAQQNGGVIPGYNYARYGSELAAAVREAEVGVPSGPVHAPNRMHLFVVESRVVTAFEDAREDVVALVMADAPTWEELRALDERLLKEAKIEYR